MVMFSLNFKQISEDLFSLTIHSHLTFALEIFDHGIGRSLTLRKQIQKGQTRYPSEGLPRKDGIINLSARVCGQ